MNKFLWLLQWILRAAIFFALLAFALNNQQEVALHFFFGNFWKAPLVLVVLIVFALGVVVGVLGMLPSWWRHRKARAHILPSTFPNDSFISKNGH